MLKSTKNWSGRQVGGVILGNPVELDGEYVWDGGVPSGRITDDGQIVTDEVGPIVAPELAPELPPVSAAEADAGVVKLEIVEDAKGGIGIKATDSGKKEVDLEAVYAVARELEVSVETVRDDVKPA